MNNMDAQKTLERSYVSSLENKEYDEADDSRNIKEEI